MFKQWSIAVDVAVGMVAVGGGWQHRALPVSTQPHENDDNHNTKADHNDGLLSLFSVFFGVLWLLPL